MSQKHAVDRAEEGDGYHIDQQGRASSNFTCLSVLDVFCVGPALFMAYSLCALDLCLASVRAHVSERAPIARGIQRPSWRAITAKTTCERLLVHHGRIKISRKDGSGFFVLVKAMLHWSVNDSLQSAKLCLITSRPAQTSYFPKSQKIC